MSNPTGSTPTPIAPAPTACTQAVDPRPRLWPGVLIVVFEWAALKLPGLVAPGTKLQIYGMMFGPMAGLAAFVLWWLFASRLRWADRLLVLAVCVGAGVAANLAFDQTFGLMVVFMYALPIITSAWVMWLLVTVRVRWPVRRIGLLVVFAIGWAYFTLLRFDGVTGSFDAELTFRWRPTPEQLFARSAHDHGEPAAGTTGDRAESAESEETLELQPGDWPGFRGAQRDGRLPGVRLATDWRANPPRLVWRHRVGPGWGSFAVVGTRLFTQEQRGGDEAVIDYDADTGAERWVHRDPARFSEELAGPGPRATPTFHDGWLYTLGAAGRLNCLDPTSGTVRWSRDIVADSGAKVPQWGFASSPLVVANIVTVFAGNPADKSVLGYDAATGEPVWAAGTGQLSYCSPQLARLHGVEQILLTTDLGLTAFDPTTGGVLWQHDWPLKDMARIAQPAVVGDSDVLIGTFFDIGTRRLRVVHSGDAWESQVLWTSRAIKPYYNDLVVHREHLYGFDSNLLTCVSLGDGKLKWKARGYGNGQVLLLPDQDLLLVLTDKGAVALVEANPDAHRELTRFQAIEGKTWNHPVIAHNKLFVRNGEEAACYDLSTSPALAAE